MAIMLPKDAYDTGLGKAISEPLLQLINQKMQHAQQTHQRRTTAQNLSMLEGITPEHAWGLSGLPPELQKIALNKHLSKPIEAQKQAALAQQGAQKEQSEIEKYERPFYERTVKEYQGAKKSSADVDRLINLVQKGDVVNPTEDHMQRWASQLLKINLKDLRGADTEEFEKIKTGFLRNAKDWFGSRVTNFDLQQILKTLPELSQSHEGKLRLLGQMKAAAQAQQIKYNSLKDIIKENGGRLPKYSEIRVEEKVGDQLDELAKQFVSGELAPKLSEAAKKGEGRHSYLRYLKGLASAGEHVAGAASSIGESVAPIAELAGKLGGF